MFSRRCGRGAARHRHPRHRGRRRHRPGRSARHGDRGLLLSHLRDRDRGVPQAARPGRGRTRSSAPTPRCCSSAWSATSRSSTTPSTTTRTRCSGAPGSSASASSSSSPSTSSAARAPGRGPPTSTARRPDMHVIVATDGSRQSLAAAKHLKSFADPTKVTEISVVAVIRPLASVAFADDTSERRLSGRRVVPRRRAERGRRRSRPSSTAGDPRSTSASAAARPPTRSSRPPSSTTRGWSWSRRAGAGSATAVLVGSTAQRVQHYAPCPVLVVRPAPKPKKRRS